MKKKIQWFFVLAILIFFGYLVLISRNEKEIQVLSFERYNTGVETVSLLSWSSLENVDHYQVTLYDKDNNIILKEKTNQTSLELENVVLEEEERFFVQVCAKTKDQKTYTTDPFGTTWKREVLKVAPVESSRESGEVAGRKKITLTTSTPGAEIYYTLDGSDPLIHGQKYEEEIQLNKSMLIQTVAKKEGYEDSNLTSFTYEVTSTKPIVYLSPSTQEYNSGIIGSKFTTEEEMMNQIADIMEPILKKKGIVVYRNKPSMTAKTASQDSKKKDVDLHFAIHSNASPEDRKGRYHGVETWIYNSKCQEAKKIAEKLQEALMTIYYDKNGDRGVLNSVEIGGLRETNPAYVNNGILMEVAFHDNWNDAVWIQKNIKKIGKTLANAIIDYYQ